MHYFKGILNFLCIYSNFDTFYRTNIYNVIDAEHEIIIIFSHKLCLAVNFVGLSMMCYTISKI